MFSAKGMAQTTYALLFQSLSQSLKRNKGQNLHCDVFMAQGWYCITSVWVFSYVTTICV